MTEDKIITITSGLLISIILTYIILGVAIITGGLING